MAVNSRIKCSILDLAVASNGGIIFSSSNHLPGSKIKISLKTYPCGDPFYAYLE